MRLERIESGYDDVRPIFALGNILLLATVLAGCAGLNGNGHLQRKQAIALTNTSKWRETEDAIEGLVGSLPLGISPAS